MTAGVDVIGLLETDAARPYIGNHDIASWLSERLDMYVDYGPGTDKHTWGWVNGENPLRYIATPTFNQGYNPAY